MLSNELNNKLHFFFYMYFKLPIIKSICYFAKYISKREELSSDGIQFKNERKKFLLNQASFLSHGGGGNQFGFDIFAI